MPTYLITYDLKTSGDYQPLWTQLRAWKAVQLLETVWLAELRGPAAVVRDLLLSHVDPEDGVVVIELQDRFDWAVSRTGPAGLSWLKARSP